MNNDERLRYMKWNYSYFLKIIKATLMLYGLENDHFAYGTSVIKRKDGKYVITEFGDTYIETLQQLADDFDLVENDTAKGILLDFAEEMLNVK